jgi:hypothetical protein
MRGYLDEDAAYFVGLLVGRGEVAEIQDRWTAVIDFPFVHSELEGFDRFTDFLSSVVTTVLPRLKALLGELVNLSCVPDRQRVAITVELPARHLAVRNLRLILGERQSHREFVIPELIFQSDGEIVREFLRGFADVAGSIRRSNRDRNGFHRVYLDVLNANWALPVQLCQLLQQRLKVPVHEILWGHPNLRDPQASRLEQSPFREHQLRIYAHDFLGVGFYINHKQEILKKLADENKQQIRRGVSDPSSPCNGARRFRPKEHHPLENDERLPEHIRGRHFDAYWQICAACGCPLAQKAIKEMKRQRRPIDDEGA